MGEGDFFKMIKKKLLITVCLFFIAMLFFGCDYSIRQVGVEFGQYPRLIYIAGVDTEIDLSDATFINIHANGKRNEFPFPEPPSQWFTLEHSVDFNTPGRYEVKILLPHDFRLVFSVQVICEEEFNELSGIVDETFFQDYAFIRYCDLEWRTPRLYP